MDNLLTFDTTTDAMRLIKKSLQLHEQVLICYCRLPTNLFDLADEAFSLTEHSSPRTGQYHSHFSAWTLNTAAACYSNVFI